MSTTPTDPVPPEQSSDWFTRARHIFYGTAATVVEMLEDPQKREENWGKMSTDLNTLADELAAKGQFTEAEAIRQMQAQQEQHTDSNHETEFSRGTSDRSPPAPSHRPSPGSVARPQSEHSQSRIDVNPEPSLHPVESISGEPVSADDISALMDLTREVGRLRRDLERLRTDEPSS